MPINFNDYDTGYRTIRGEDINNLRDFVNNLEDGDEGGTYTGTFDGIIGGTTPADRDWETVS